MRLVEEMDKVVACLALEVPGAVYEDVVVKWTRLREQVLRHSEMVDAWDHFHDECFLDEPFLRGRVHAEVERLEAVLHARSPES